MKVIALDDQNLKAVYRAALGLYKLEEYEKALKMLKNRENFEDNKELLVLYSKIRKDYQIYKKKEKEMFAKIFKNHK